MAFNFKKLIIPDVILVTPQIHGDSRGFFAEMYKQSDFEKNGISPKFIQINHSCSRKGVLRGMHYQLSPYAQGKLVCVVKGEIFDVAVDIRKGSPSFGKWVGEILSEENRKLLYVPEGFAHGFCVLSETAEVIYYCTKEYAPEHDRGIIYNDPAAAIDWPLKQPTLSGKDSTLPLLKNAENSFEY